MAIAIWTADEIEVHHGSCDDEPAAAGTFLHDDHEESGSVDHGKRRRDDEDVAVLDSFWDHPSLSRASQSFRNCDRYQNLKEDFSRREAVLVAKDL